MVCLGVCDGCEPGAEGLAVRGGVKTEKIGGSVRVAVVCVEDERYRNTQRAPAPEQMQLKVAGSYRGLAARHRQWCGLKFFRFQQAELGTAGSIFGNDTMDAEP